MALSLDTAVQQRLIEFVLLLQKWNRAYNLTAIRDPRQMVVRHLLDSLVIVPYLQGERVLDVGCGAGLPGIPLALAEPQRHFTLLDSNGKKTRFVTQACAELGLDNVDVVQSRVELFQADRAYTSITARAFSSVAELLQQSEHLLAENGRYLLMKGVAPVAELDAVPANFELEAMLPLRVPLLDAERHLLILKRA